MIQTARMSPSLMHAVGQIEKRFSVTRVEPGPVEWMSTGIDGLDQVIKGFPKGRLTHIWGPESSGKTSAGLAGAGSCQRAGGSAAYIDFEGVVEMAWARRWGVSLKDLLLFQPKVAETGLEIGDALIKAGVDYIVIDSTAALMPRCEEQSDIGDVNRERVNDLIDQAARKFSIRAAASGAVVVFISQVRENQTVIFGDRMQHTGGKMLDHFASLGVWLNRTQIIKKGGRSREAVGVRVMASVRKNRVGSPHTSGEFDLIFDK